MTLATRCIRLSPLIVTARNQRLDFPLLRVSTPSRWSSGSVFEAPAVVSAGREDRSRHGEGEGRRDALVIRVKKDLKRSEGDLALVSAVFKAPAPVRERREYGPRTRESGGGRHEAVYGVTRDLQPKGGGADPWSAVFDSPTTGSTGDWDGWRVGQGGRGRAESVDTVTRNLKKPGGDSDLWGSLIDSAATRLTADRDEPRTAESGGENDELVDGSMKDLERRPGDSGFWSSLIESTGTGLKGDGDGQRTGEARGEHEEWMDGLMKNFDRMAAEPADADSWGRRGGGFIVPAFEAIPVSDPSETGESTDYVVRQVRETGTESTFLRDDRVSQYTMEPIIRDTFEDALDELQQYATPKQLSRCYAQGPLDLAAFVCGSLRKLDPSEPMRKELVDEIKAAVKKSEFRDQKRYFLQLARALTTWKPGETPFSHSEIVRRLLQLSWHFAKAKVSMAGDMLIYFEIGWLMQELDTGSRMPMILSSIDEARSVHRHITKTEPFRQARWAERLKYELRAAQLSTADREARKAELVAAFDVIHSCMTGRVKLPPGVPRAQYIAQAAGVLGEAYLTGDVVPRDLDKAEYLLERGVNDTYPGEENAFRLARAYIGEGNRIIPRSGPQPVFERHVPKALHYYRQASVSNAVAAYELGELYHWCPRRHESREAHFEEFGVMPDEDLAAEYISLAGNRRHKKAMARAVEMYQSGLWERPPWMDGWHGMVRAASANDRGI